MGTIYETCCATGADQGEQPDPQLSALARELESELYRLLPLAVARWQSQTDLSTGGAVVVLYPDVGSTKVEFLVGVAGPRMSAYLVAEMMGADRHNSDRDWRPEELATLVDVAELGPAAARFVELCEELTQRVIIPSNQTDLSHSAPGAFTGFEELREVALQSARRANSGRETAPNDPAASSGCPPSTYYGLGLHGHHLMDDIRGSLS
jgi:hypothetical protein